MRTLGIVWGLAVCTCALVHADAIACGDKFIVGPAGAKLEQAAVASTPARILIYRDMGADATSALADPELISALKDAGHTPVTADGTGGLEKAIAGGAFDLVLVDYLSAQKVRDEVKGAGSHPSVVPVLNRASRQFLSEAKREFKVVMNVPATVSSVLSTIDKAMSKR